MSSKRKWDQEAPDGDASAPAAKAVKHEDNKSASEAAAAAASAIAAKIAAQYADGGLAGKDPHDGEFTHDIDINDVRNRYLLTKGTTQDQIHEETGASVANKGVWIPDRSKATERDPPLYLHISASSKEQLDKAVAKVNELIAMDLGSLTEDKTNQQRTRRKWPEEKLNVGLESLRNFNVRAKVVGPSGTFVKFIQQDTSTRVQIKGMGSGFVEQETGRESDEPMHIHITGPDEQQVARAKFLTEDLLDKVREEHGKSKAVLQQQQLELHQAQMAYVYAGNYAGYMTQQPSAPAPPPPPGEAPPPPPGAPPPAPDGSQQTASSGTPGAQPGQPPSSSDVDAYARYWAAYGYDVNSPEFKQWQAQQQQQYAQYYAQYDTTGGGSAAGSSVSPPPPSGAQPPPPPPSAESAPPPPPS